MGPAIIQRLTTDDITIIGNAASSVYATVENAAGIEFVRNTTYFRVVRSIAGPAIDREAIYVVIVGNAPGVAIIEDTVGPAITQHASAGTAVINRNTASIAVSEGVIVRNVTSLEAVRSTSPISVWSTPGPTHVIVG